MKHSNQLTAALHRWMEVSMHRSMRGFFLYSKTCGLSMSQLGALFRLYHKGARGVSDIGDDLGVTSAAASQMLERLVRQDLVLRSEDPVDRRVKQLVLTDKGRQILHETVRARQGWLEQVAQQLTPQEQEQVVAALTLLIEKTDRLDNVSERKA